MPGRRRPPAHISIAAKLSASRLPLGTPQLHLRRSPRAGRSLSSSSGTSSKSPTPTEGRLQREPDTVEPTQPQHKQASPEGLASATSMSLADAKLERQNRRIAEANAVIASTHHADKPRSSGRGKARVWKPFDFAAEHSQHDIEPTLPNPNLRVPIIETRVNIFRAPSRGSSSPRPISRNSQQTFGSGNSDPDHRDLEYLEAGDFQVFTGRRERRNAAGLGAYGDRPEAQQKTVEASFSKREICDVFGNELPVPSFLDGNPGSANGQLQLIQHPNGDVSAHQWSSTHFEYQNIGQFSNIRKRVEGQLGTDRLKGETARQALQQHTLAYFRLVAKQREASVTGLPFGLKDIVAGLPDSVEASMTPGLVRKLNAATDTPGQNSQAKAQREEGTASVPLQAWDHFNGRANRAKPDASQLGANSSISRLNPVRNFIPAAQNGTKTDTYSPLVSSPGGYGPYPYQQQYARLGYTGGASFAYGVPYHMPLASHQYHMHMGQPLYQHQPSYATEVMRVHPQEQELASQYVNGHSQLSEARSIVSETSGSTVTADVASHQLRSKPADVQDTRSVMRDYMMKIGEQAKERNRSQINIRTVLYDPFQSETATVMSGSNADQSKLDEPPDTPIGSDAADSAPIQHAQPAFTKAAMEMKAHADILAMDNNLLDSSPDRGWQRKPAERLDFTTPGLRSTDQSTRQYFRGTYLSETPPGLASIDHGIKQLTREEQVNEWWWSGTNFMRQEAYYQSLVAADKKPKPPTMSSPERIKPIGPPSQAAISKAKERRKDESVIDVGRLLLPVFENLASYVGPQAEKRRDYFCQWTKAPEWCIDRSPEGNNSFFDTEWGQPPARLGRDARFSRMPSELRFGSFDGNTVSGRGADRKLVLGGRH